MNLMPSISRFLVTLNAVFLLMAGNTYAQEDPHTVITQMSDALFTRLNNEQQLIDADSDRAKIILEEELMPFVDHQFAALKALGKHFKKVPRDQLPEYFNAFRQNLLTTFTATVGEYDNHKVVFQPANNIANKKVVTIKAIIKQEGAPDVNIAFKLRKNKKDNRWKAFDLVAEGISLLNTKRAEIEAIVRNDGIDAVIAALNKNRT